MNKKKLLLGAVLIFFMGLSFISPAEAKMIKEVAIGVMSDAPSQADCDRQYIRYHGPEVTRLSGPWMTRYQLWLPYVPPEEAVERFGAVRGRYAELWYREDDYADRPSSLKGQTFPWWNEGKRASGQTTVTVYANPTEEFYDSDPHPDNTSILRWVTIIRYPEGVSVEDGEKWFLEVHAKQAMKQPGLLKFVSHRVVNIKNNNATNAMSNMPPSGMEMPPEISGGRSWWVRVCEYWYKDFDAWRKAILESPPAYTLPPWGGEYPFVDMASTFIPYYHDVDFLKGTYQVDFARE